MSCRTPGKARTGGASCDRREKRHRAPAGLSLRAILPAPGPHTKPPFGAGRSRQCRCLTHPRRFAESRADFRWGRVTPLIAPQTRPPDRSRRFRGVQGRIRAAHTGPDHDASPAGAVSDPAPLPGWQSGVSGMRGARIGAAAAGSAKARAGVSREDLRYRAITPGWCLPMRCDPARVPWSHAIQSPKRQGICRVMPGSAGVCRSMAEYGGVWRGYSGLA